MDQDDKNKQAEPEDLFQRLIDEAPDAQEEPAAQAEVVPTGVSLPASNPNQPTMSSLQIAEITGKPHNDVLKDIRRILEEAEIDAGKFSHVYSGGNGQARPCYILPRRECDLVVSGYSVKYRLAIIDRWQELEAKQAQPYPSKILNDAAAMRGLLLGYTEQVISLQSTVSELQPKADSLERIARAEGEMCISNAAKVLQVPPRKFFKWLKQNNWIFRRGKEWLPYQAREAQGVLDCKITTVYRGDGSERTCYQTLVTSKGIARLAEIFERKGFEV